MISYVQVASVFSPSTFSFFSLKTDSRVRSSLTVKIKQIIFLSFAIKLLPPLKVQANGSNLKQIPLNWCKSVKLS